MHKVIRIIIELTAILIVELAVILSLIAIIFVLCSTPKKYCYPLVDEKNIEYNRWIIEEQKKDFGYVEDD